MEDNLKRKASEGSSVDILKQKEENRETQKDENHGKRETAYVIFWLQTN